jgi:hypothetical protein
MKIIYQALLPLLLSLTSNSEACDLCVGLDFDASQSINETTSCSVFGFAALGDEGQGVDADECASLNVGATASGCCFTLAPTVSPAAAPPSCSICGDKTLTNPSFEIEYDNPDTTEIEMYTCTKYEEFQVVAVNLLLAFGATEEDITPVCKEAFDNAKNQGCQCDGSPAAHANVKIASLVVVGVTFMASFFF